MAAKVSLLDKVSNFLGLSDGYVNEEDNEVVERDIEEAPVKTTTNSYSEKKENNFNAIEEDDFDVELDTGDRLFTSKKQNADETVSEEDVSPVKAERKSLFGNRQENKQNTDSVSKRGETNKMVNVSESDKMNIYFARPVSYSDDFCREVCSNMRSKRMVTISFENVRNENDKLRIYDFVRGCSVALDCKFEQVSNQVFIVAPCNAKIFKSSDKEDMDENSERSEGYSFSRY